MPKVARDCDQLPQACPSSFVAHSGMCQLQWCALHWLVFATQNALATLSACGPVQAADLLADNSTVETVCEHASCHVRKALGLAPASVSVASMLYSDLAKAPSQ
eukprot:jgi/Ulvmu1/1757/UM117_0034.1